MRRRWPQILSTVVVLLLALVVALINAQGGADESPSATARPASAIAAAASTATTRPATPQASSTAAATRPPPTATRTVARAAATRTPTARTLPPTPTPDGTLPTIPFAQLPVQAQETIQLIDQGGPFPYDRDGITFGNRERLLPIKSGDYYREYTVITPGSSDRGARRIVAGREGELYYTDDHYESFRRIIR